MWPLHEGRESCDVGLKSDLFRGIQLAEQFLYWNKVLLLRFWVLWEINSRFCNKTQWQMFLMVCRPPCWCPSRWAPTWRLHTNLYKFVENVSPHISHKKNHCDLNLGESLCILPSFYFQISDLIYWTVLIFYFDLFWMAWHWKPAITLLWKWQNICGCSGLLGRV